MNSFVLFLISISCFFLMVKSEFNLKSSLNLPLGIDYAQQTYLDEDEGYIYFVDKRRNNDYFLWKYDMYTLDYLDYSKIIDNFETGAIDTVNKLLYVVPSSGSQVAKIDLNTMQVVDSITLSVPSYSNSKKVEIDTLNQKAYVGYRDPICIVKVDLASFTEESNLTLSNDKVTGSVIDVDNGILYAATDSTFGGNAIIYKIALSTFTQVDSLLVNLSGVSYLRYGVIDNSTQMMYFGTNQYPMNIVKINLTDLTSVGSINPSLQPSCLGTGIDVPNGFAYFLSEYYLSKLDLTTFTIADSYNLQNDYFTSMAIDSSAQNAYIATSEHEIYQVNLPALTNGSKSNDMIYIFAQLILVDETNQIAYIYFDSYGGVIVKINLQSFSFVDYLIIGLSLDIYDGEIDNTNGFIYLFPDNGNLVIMKIRLSDFSINETVQVASSGSVSYTYFDKQNQLLYVVFHNSSDNTRNLMEISCPDLQIIDSLDFGNVDVSRAFFDISREYSYIWYYNFSAVGSRYFVYKVELSNLSIIDQIDLTGYDIDECILDKTDQLLYILYYNIDYYFLRSIDLVNMQVMNNTLNTTYNYYFIFLIEPNDALLFLDMGYYNESSDEYEGVVLLQIEASSNELISNTSFDHDLFDYYEYGSDPSTNYGYLLDFSSNPVTFYQISFTSPPSSSQQILFSFLIFGIMILILGLF